MSRVLAWRRFIEVRLEDDSGNPVTAFEIAPLPAARDVFGRHRLVYRPRQDGIALYYRVSFTATPPLMGEITDRVRMNFALRLRDGSFFSRFHPDLTAAQGPGLYFDNLDGSGAILGDGSVLSDGAMVSSADAVEIGPDRFPVTLDLSASNPTQVEASDPVSGAVVVNEEVFASPGATLASVVLDLSAAGPAHFSAAEIPAGPVDRRIYADEPAVAARANAVLEIYWETAQDTVPSLDGLIYRVVFERR